MHRHFAILLAASVVLAHPARAQRGDEHGRPDGGRPDGGRPFAPPSHRDFPPPPAPRVQPNAAPLVERRPDGRLDNTPHVVNGTWYGHPAPNDPRFRVVTPYPHGRFAYIGPTHRWGFARVIPAQREVFLPGGYGFLVSPDDWRFASGWCWTCASNFVVYDDPDHPGWYLLYNLATGTYAHVQYAGI